MTTVVFFVFAAIALVGAFGVVLARNPVHSALLLVLTLVSIAVFFLMQDAQLVAAVQIIVYASAIVVLFLFVIMLLGVDRAERIVEPLRGQRPLAVGLGAVLLVQLLYLGGRTWATGLACTDDACRPVVDGGGNVEAVARSMFTTYLWPFELTAVLLVIAVVGGVVIARRGGAVAGGEEEAVPPTMPDPEESPS